MFDNEKRALIALAGSTQVCLVPGLANRPGLICGATGTGQTVPLQNLAETFRAMGRPGFAADVTGALSGVSLAVGPP